MGVYIKAQLVSENDTHVMYRYGTSHEDLDCLLKIEKNTFALARIIDDVEYPQDVPSVMIASRIFGYYETHKRFPAEITKQA